MAIPSWTDLYPDYSPRKPGIYTDEELLEKFNSVTAGYPLHQRVIPRLLGVTPGEARRIRRTRCSGMPKRRQWNPHMNTSRWRLIGAWPGALVQLDSTLLTHLQIPRHTKRAAFPDSYWCSCAVDSLTGFTAFSFGSEPKSELAWEALRRLKSRLFGWRGIVLCDMDDAMLSGYFNLGLQNLGYELRPTRSAISHATSLAERNLRSVKSAYAAQFPGSGAPSLDDLKKVGRKWEWVQNFLQPIRRARNENAIPTAGQALTVARDECHRSNGQRVFYPPLIHDYREAIAASVALDIHPLFARHLPLLKVDGRIVASWVQLGNLTGMKRAAWEEDR